MIHDDAHEPDDLEQVDSIHDLNGDGVEGDGFQQVDSFDDLKRTNGSQDELDHVDNFRDLGDDLVIHGDAATEEEEPAPAEPDPGPIDIPAVTETDTTSEAELEEDLGASRLESESAVGSEEISIAGESESGTTSHEIDEVAVAARLVISPTPASVISGEQITFSVEAFDKDNNPVEPPTVKWTAKGGEITKAGVYTVGRSAGLFSVKASAKGFSDRLEGIIEAAPSRNEWVLASFFSACGIYLALGLTYFLDPAVLGPSKNFIGYFDFDWAVATILVGPCVICFISSSLGVLSRPRGKEWLLLLPSFGPVIPVVLGAISVMAFF